MKTPVRVRNRFKVQLPQLRQTHSQSGIWIGAIGSTQFDIGWYPRLPFALGQHLVYLLRVVVVTFPATVGVVILVFACRDHMARIRANRMTYSEIRIPARHKDDVKLTPYWTSDHPEVATVDERGRVIYHRPGKVTITFFTPSGPRYAHFEFK